MQPSPQSPASAGESPKPITSGRAIQEMLTIARSLAGPEMIVETLPSVVRTGLRITTLAAASKRWTTVTTNDPSKPLTSARFVVERAGGGQFTSHLHSVRDLDELDSFVRVVVGSARGVAA